MKAGTGIGLDACGSGTADLNVGWGGKFMVMLFGQPLTDMEIGSPWSWPRYIRTMDGQDNSKNAKDQKPDSWPVFAFLEAYICKVCNSKTMSSNVEIPSSDGCEKVVLSSDQQMKICEVKRLLGPLSSKSSIYCSDSSISRYLRARNWNVKKATKMLKATLKWRSAYKPDEIHWDEVAHEAETGKVYCANYKDQRGRTVIVMRPCHQNSKTAKEQIRYLVYCMESAVLNLPPDQERMIWLIDFQDFTMSNISLKATKETAHVLQEHYPERLGVAILYNAPKIFEPFYMVVKPFLDTKTANKVKFVYSDDLNTKKIMEDMFDMDQLESAFGGNNSTDFDITKYAEMMKEDDQKTISFWSGINPTPSVSENAWSSDLVHIQNSTSSSESSDNEKTYVNQTDEIVLKALSSNHTIDNDVSTKAS